MNNNKSFIIIISVFFLLAGCSFDSKTGIWSGEQNEKKINKKDENKILNVEKIYSSEQFIPEEMHAIKNITLSAPKKNSSWFTSNLNSQNFKGHLYLSGVENNFLKKKNRKK